MRSMIGLPSMLPLHSSEILLGASLSPLTDLCISGHRDSEIIILIGSCSRGELIRAYNAELNSAIPIVGRVTGDPAIVSRIKRPGLVRSNILLSYITPGAPK